MAKKKKAKRREIRINDPSDTVYEGVAKLAEENKRTNGKQAEFMLEEILKNTALILFFMLCLSGCNPAPSDHDINELVSVSEQHGKLKYENAMSTWCVKNGVYVNMDAIDSIYNTMTSK